MNALIDADGPDAIGLYYGNPSGFSSSNVLFMNGWLDAIGTQSRYAVGSVDQNAMHVVADGDVRIDADGAGVRRRQLRLLPAGRHQPRGQRMELAGDGARRMETSAGRDRSQAPRSSSSTRCEPRPRTRRIVHLAVRPGQDWALLLAMVKVILDEGLEHRRRTAAISPPGWTSCARSSPRPTSTTLLRGATSRAR